MIYYIFSALFNKFPGANLLKYITFRTFCALFTSFIITLYICPIVIKVLKQKQKNGQPIRKDGPETHVKKNGTPTMGGLLICASTIVSSLLWADIANKYVLSTIMIGVYFATIGFLDDYQKVKLQTSVGLTPKQKICLQAVGALVFAFYIESIRTSDVYGMLTFPFFKDFAINLGMFLPLFTSFVIVGSANAVNLTDGLDGLVTVPAILCAACFGLICYLVGHSVFANYLQLKFIPNTGELCIICGALIGSGLGFLWYNSPPAKIFMGDTGSLYIGSTIAALSIIVKQEFLLVIVGGIFVLETVSVIIQVLYYKITKKRIFLMAPIHHHFEKKGWSESTVVIRFWIISTLLALISLATLKVR